MSEHMKRLKEVSALFDKAKAAKDETEKKELMDEFWNDAFDLAEEVVDEPILNSGFTAAEQIKNLKFEL